MPLPEQALNEFTRERVERHRPGQPGVYALFTAEQRCVYVGSGDIRSRLLAHLDERDTCIASHRPTHWIERPLLLTYKTAVALIPDLDRRALELIDELDPLCRDGQDEGDGEGDGTG